VTGRVRLPAPLRPGARVALGAPCGVVDVDRLEAGADTLRRWGWEPVELPHVRDRCGHLAGPDDARLDDLQAAIDDPTLRAIWVVRGGFGLTRIVDRLDLRGLRDAPRWVVGFSDVTALHHAVWRRAGVVSCHGQFAGRAHLVSRHADAATHLRALLAGEVAAGPLPRLAGDPPPRTVVRGRAAGPLLGGNLAVTAAGLGTPNALDARDAVLMLEDVNESPYRLDRLLTQLRAAGVLDGVAGVVLGTFVGCDPDPGVPSAPVEEVVHDRLGDLGVPVLAGLPLGHQDRQLAVPHGAPVVLDADAGTLAVVGAVTA
jgi:muramoyltetrapeptide carboxypeptidase